MPHTCDSDEQSRGDGDAPGLLVPVTVERNPIDQIPPGILQARTLEWVAISFSNAEMSAIVGYFEHSCVLPFLGIGMKSDPFQPCGHC